MTKTTQPCQDPSNQFGCTDKTQCFEPCGDLGHSEEHVAVATIEPVIVKEYHSHDHGHNHDHGGCGGKKSKCCGRCKTAVVA